MYFFSIKCSRYVADCVLNNKSVTTDGFKVKELPRNLPGAETLTFLQSVKKLPSFYGI
jgi:hypothetical protein